MSPVDLLQFFVYLKVSLILLKAVSASGPLDAYGNRNFTMLSRASVLLLPFACPEGSWVGHLGQGNDPAQFRNQSECEALAEQSSGVSKVTPGNIPKGDHLDSTRTGLGCTTATRLLLKTVNAFRLRLTVSLALPGAISVLGTERGSRANTRRFELETQRARPLSLSHAVLIKEGYESFFQEKAKQSPGFRVSV